MNKELKRMNKIKRSLREIRSKEPIEIRKPIAEARKSVKPIPSVPRQPMYTFRIALKSEEKIKVRDIRISPRVSLKRLRFSKPSIIWMEIPLTKSISPRVSISLTKIADKIRVMVSEPLSVQLFAPMKLRIKARPIRNISVRPLVEPEVISLAKSLTKPSLKVSPLATICPQIYSAIPVKQSPLLIPSLKLSPGFEEKRELIHEASIRIPEMTKKAMKINAFQLEAYTLPESLAEKDYFDKEFLDLGGLGNISTEGFVCILVDKSGGFHEFIKLLCAKIWRIKGRGLPSVAHRGYNEELGLYGIQEDIVEVDKIQRWLEDLTEDRLKTLNNVREFFEQEVKSMSIEGRLKFLILPIDKKLFDKAYKLLTDPKLEIERYLRHGIFIAYKLNKKLDEDFSGRKLIARMLTAAFGFVEIQISRYDIGEYALKLESEFYKNLSRIFGLVRKNVSALYWPRPGIERDQQESWLHWALKHLAYAHLILNEGIQENYIKSEVEKVGGKIADVVCNDPNKPIVIEIETMYGTGDPIAKINETIRSYYNEFNGELWLLIPNLHALLYTKSLLKLRKEYRKHGLNLEIYVADVTGVGYKKIFGKPRKPGLIRLIDVLKFIKAEKNTNIVQ